MNTRKNYNSIVFLAAFFGLVLVGATPQVLAQSGDRSVDSNKISILVPGEGYVFTFDLNPVIKLNKLAATESLPVNLSGRLVPAQQNVTNWEILSASGNQKVVDFLRKEYFAPLISSQPQVSSELGDWFLFPEQLYQSIEVDKTNITFTKTDTFSDAKRAARFAEMFRRMSEYVKSPTADKKIAGNLYLTNTQVRAENAQVFVVTRLPRASIDELLAKTAQ